MDERDRPADPPAEGSAGLATTAATAMEVGRVTAGGMAVAGGEPGGDAGRPTTRRPGPASPASRRRLLGRLGVVLAAVLLVALGATRFAAGPRTGTVAIDPDPRPVVDAVPTGPIIQRWEVGLPRDQSVVGLAVLDDRVLAAAVARPALRVRDELVVSAHDLLDGRRLWSRAVPGSASTVVVTTRSGPVLLPRRASDRPGAPETGRERVVALDPDDGTATWQVALPGDATVVARPDRDAIVVSTGRAVTELDARTGARRQHFPALDGPEGTRLARLVEDTWVVPRPDGWAILDDAGKVALDLPGRSVLPGITPTLVASADQGRVWGWSRRDRARAFGVDLEGTVVGLSRPAPRVLAVAGASARADAVLAVQAVPAGGSPAFDQVTHLLGPDGTLLATVDSSSGALDPDHVLGVEIDGNPRTLCLDAPEWLHDGDRSTPGPCPADLGLLDANGALLARRQVDLAVPTWPIEPLLTQAGPVMHERGRLHLYRWEGLAEAWSIPVGNFDPHLVLVATSHRGVAVGSNSPLPATVSFHA